MPRGASDYSERVSELDVPAAESGWNGAPSLSLDVLNRQAARDAVEKLRPIMRQKRRELEQLEDTYRVLLEWANE